MVINWKPYGSSVDDEVRKVTIRRHCIFLSSAEKAKTFYRLLGRVTCKNPGRNTCLVAKTDAGWSSQKLS